MTGGNDAIAALIEALKISPDNLPLRRHLADSLYGIGRFDDALHEYRTCLTADPANPQIKLSLAKTYQQLNNTSAAFVIVEELVKSPPVAPQTRMLYCRLLAKSGQLDQAAYEYKKAVGEDPSVADAALALQLDVDSRTGNDKDQPEYAEDEFEERRIAVPREDMAENFDGTLERPKVNFADVGGMEKLKEEIRMKIIHPLTHPDLYKAYGKTIGGGILMYGPPGCGKTFIARATAGEVKASFICVGINDVLDMWIGNSEKNLHEIFETARRNTPCVMFFDEVDALGASRTDMRQSSGKQLINQFLSEMDGAKSSNDGLLILGATNAPWHLDPAFRRPGRFDRILFVPPPDGGARSDILRAMLKGKPADGVDFEAVASKTDHFSGADLKAVVDIAIEEKLREAMKKGIPSPLNTKDLISAAKKHKATTKEWFSTARNYAIYSNQGGVYDDILEWLKLK